MNRIIVAALLVAICPINLFAQNMVAAAADITGIVKFKGPGQTELTTMVKGQPIKGGTEIRVTKDSSLIIAYSNGTKMRIGPLSVFKIEEVSNSKISTFLGMGKIESWVKKFAKGGVFQVRSKLAVAAVRGTELRSVSYASMNYFNEPLEAIVPTGLDTVCFNGSVSVASSNGEIQTLGGGDVTKTDSTGDSTPPAKTSEPAPAEPAVAIPTALATTATPSSETTSTEEAPAETTTQSETTTTSPVQETTTSSSSSCTATSTSSCP